MLMDITSLGIAIGEVSAPDFVQGFREGFDSVINS